MVSKVKILIDKTPVKAHTPHTMKDYLRDWSKKKVAGGAVIIILGIAGITTALNSPQSTDATDSPLTEEVARQGERLDNHEARITNSENDIKDLQDKTGTPPSTTHMVVPGINTTSTGSTSPGTNHDGSPAPAGSGSSSTPTPPPVTITSVHQVPNGNNIDCSLTYSDGSSATKQWYVVAKNEGSVKVDYYVGACDNSMIGKIK